MAVRKRWWPDADGNARSAWQATYKDQTGRRRSKQFVRKKDADAWLIQVAGEVRSGVHTPESTSITIREAASLWLESVRDHDREPTTIAAYEQHVRLHIAPRCGDLKLSQLTAPRVRSLLDQWLKDLSRPMALRVFRSFKAILSDSQERGLVAQNVALAVRVRNSKREKAKASPPSKAELRAILAAAGRSDDIKGRALIELAISSGMRASEIRGLAWAQIDLQNATVTVVQRADARGTIGPPKSAAGYRTIPIPTRVVSALREWKLACPSHRLGLVFPSARGNVLSHGIMAKSHLSPILVSAGVTKGDGSVAKYSAHIFRHAAASLWIEQGLNPKRVQTLVGHGSIQVTFDTYGHLFEQAERDANDVNAIERALFADAT